MPDIVAVKTPLKSQLSQSSGLHEIHLFGLLLLAALLLGFDTISHLKGGIGDEDVHRYQIGWFMQGRFEIFQYVTMLPLYHLIVAAIAKLTGLVSLNGIRFSHMLFAASVIPAMYFTVKRFFPAEAIPRTLLLVFIPFFFPLFFLTYTDLPSLMVVLFMVERCWQRHYGVAGLLALAAVLLRQPNIIWVAFCSCMIALQVAREMQLRLILTNVLNPKFLQQVLWRNRFMVVVYVLFVLFVAVNGGVAVGDAEQHPISFNLSNLYFFLLVAWAVFLPFNVEQLPQIKLLLIRHWWIALVLVAGFFVYFYTYGHPHKYNSATLVFYGHNWFLHYTSDVTLWRVLSYIPIAWMGLSYVVAVRTSVHGDLLLLLVPFALLSFVPLPLIEQRYYFVALALIMLWRPPMSRLSTLINLAGFLVLSAFILFNVSRQSFFL